MARRHTEALRSDEWMRVRAAAETRVYPVVIQGYSVAPLHAHIGLFLSYWVGARARRNVNMIFPIDVV